MAIENSHNKPSAQVSSYKIIGETQVSSCQYHADIKGTHQVLDYSVNIAVYH